MLDTPARIAYKPDINHAPPETAMTRKDYELIAAAIKASHTDPESGIVVPDREFVAVGQTAHRIAKALAADNPRFNKALFLRACGF